MGDMCEILRHNNLDILSYTEAQGLYFWYLKIFLLTTYGT